MKKVVDGICAALKSQVAGGKGLRLPAGGELLWQWFADLNRSRTYHAAGPNPIQPSEIEAYARSRRWPLEPRHIDALQAIDQAFMEAVSQRETAAPEGVKTSPPIGERPVTAGLFDAVFG